MSVLLEVALVAQAATLQVPGDHPTLGEAVAAAAAGDVIELAPGTWNGPVQITVDLAIVGTGGAAVTTIHGVGGTALEVTGAAVDVTGVTLTADPGPWPTARLTDGDVALTDVTVTGADPRSGAAIVALRTPLAITASTLADNAGEHGHLWLDQSPLVATDVTASNGGTGAYADGVYAVDSEITWTRGTVSDHPVLAFDVTGAPVTFDGTTFLGNTAAVHTYDGHVTISDAWIEGGGGASAEMVAAYSGATIQRTTFLDVESYTILGVGGGEVVIEDCVFDGTRSEWGVVTGGGLPFTFRRNVVIGCTNEGLYLVEGYTDEASVEDNLFVDNLVGTSLVACLTGYAQAVRRNVFVGNRSSYLVDVQNLDDVGYVEDNVFVGNEAHAMVHFWTTPIEITGNLFLGDTLTAWVLDPAIIHGSHDDDTSFPVLISQNSFVGTGAASGVTGHVLGSDLDAAYTYFTNNLVLGHQGGPAIATGATLAHNLFWANTADVTNGGALPATKLAVDPMLALWVPGYAAVDLVPLPGSPLVDAGDPAVLDLDGTVSDIGFTGGPDPDPALLVDADLDGTSARFDCDEADATVFPGAVEACGDEVDQDCDGDPETGLLYDDLDGDGLGDPATAGPGDACAPGDRVLVGGDCADDDPGRSPAAAEACDGIDQDCDGAVDDGATATWYADADGDGFGDPAAAAEGCGGPGWAANGDDCDDTSAARTVDCTEPPDTDPPVTDGDTDAPGQGGGGGGGGKAAGGCGCAAPGGAPGWVALAVGALLLRRRR